MQYAVLDHHERPIAFGQSDNAYQIRNLLITHLQEPFAYEDDNTITTRSHLKLKCTANLRRLLQCTPVVEEKPILIISKPTEPTRPPFKPVNTNLITLKTLCEELRLNPIIARRILRRHLGTHNVKYEWPTEQVPQIKSILQTRK